MKEVLANGLILIAKVDIVTIKDAQFQRVMNVQDINRDKRRMKASAEDVDTLETSESESSLTTSYSTTNTEDVEIENPYDNYSEIEDESYAEIDCQTYHDEQHVPCIPSYQQHEGEQYHDGQRREHVYLI